MAAIALGRRGNLYCLNVYLKRKPRPRDKYPESLASILSTALWST